MKSNQLCINIIQTSKQQQHLKSFSKRISMTTALLSTSYLIDQQYQVSKGFLNTQITNTNAAQSIEQFTKILGERNHLKQTARSQGSYQVILEQSLTSQDKPFLYEILTENSPDIIHSSLIDLAPKKVIQLLKMIHTLLEQHIKLGKGSDHCVSIGLWLQELIKLHLTTIVSNPQNRATIQGIRKFITKKTQQKAHLIQIKQHLLEEDSARQLQTIANNSLTINRKVPKFQYIEEEKQHLQEQHNQQSQNDSEIKDQDMQGLDIDELMEDFNDDDF